MSMDRGIRDFWIQLMESEKYKFGKEGLNRDNKLDAFGVLCEIAVSCGVTEREISEYGGLKTIKYDGNGSSFSFKLQRWAGITDGQTNVIYDINDHSNDYQPIINYIKEVL